MNYENENSSWEGGYSTKSYTGRPRPKVQPLYVHPQLYNIFNRKKKYLVRVPSIDKWYLFHILILVICISFKCQFPIHLLHLNQRNPYPFNLYQGASCRLSQGDSKTYKISASPQQQTNESCGNLPVVDLDQYN